MKKDTGKKEMPEPTTGETKEKGGAVSEKGKHSLHGADGSHQDSHKKLGGSRARIVTGHPDELRDGDGES